MNKSVCFTLFNLLSSARNIKKIKKTDRHTQETASFTDILYFIKLCVIVTIYVYSNFKHSNIHKLNTHGVLITFFLFLKRASCGLLIK